MGKYFENLKNWKTALKIVGLASTIVTSSLLYNYLKKEEPIPENTKKVFMYTMKVANDNETSKYLLREFPIGNSDVFVPAFYEFKKDKDNEPMYTQRVSQRSIDVVVDEVKRQNKQIMPYIYCQNDKSKILEKILLKPDESIKDIKESFEKQEQLGNKYDGLIIDYESGTFNEEEKSKYGDLLVNYMNKIKKEFGEKYKIGIAVGMQFSEKGFFNYKELGKIVDYVHIMCYDYTSPDLPPGLPNEKLIDVLDYASKTIPKEKITILFASYATRWTKKQGENKPKKHVNFSEGIEKELKKDWGFVGRNQGELEFRRRIKNKKGTFNQKYFTFDKKTFEDRFKILEQYSIVNAGIFQHVVDRKITDRHMMIYTPLNTWRNTKSD